MSNILHKATQVQIDRQREYTALTREYIKANYIHHPLAYIQTFGCQQNVSDSERIRGMLMKMDYGFTTDISCADLVLFNTCAIREGAEDKIFGNIGELKRLKKENPSMVIALCGCMVQQERITDKIKKSYPFVNLVFGTHVTYTLPELLYNALTTESRIFSTSEDSENIVEEIPIHREDTIKGNIPIMYGCDNFCSYCIVPYVRGRERSRNSADILAEAKDLISKGYKELMLLGQNVNSYGKGLTENINFSDLLRMINALDGDFTIRFMTSHPKDCTNELIDTIAECKKICRHIHLPVQSGNNRILKEMNRSYTREEYLSLISYAKEKVSDITFSSDIIVGFPSENYEEFLDTLSLVEEVKYTQLFTFIYSQRPGTKAADMDDIVLYEEKTKWINELLNMQVNITSDIHKSMVGMTVSVLIDGVKKSDGTKLVGRTVHGILVEIDGDTKLIGNFINVKIHTAQNTLIKGNIVC